MPINWYMFLVSALIPLAVGFIYYHKNVFGTAWMKTNGFTEESMDDSNLALTLGLIFILGAPDSKISG